MDQAPNHIPSNPVSGPMVDQETRAVPGAASILNLAAIGDLHCTKASQGKLPAILAALAGRADVLLLCGDLTDNGTPEEARVLAAEMSKTVNIPKLAVLGNHDYETGHEDEVRQILTEAGVRCWTAMPW